MHTLLIHQAFASPDDPGGTRHYEFGKHLVKCGHRFTVVAGDISYMTGRSLVDSNGLIAEQILDGMRVLRVYTYPSLHRSFLWRVVSFLSFMCTSVIVGLQAGPVDLVMGTSPPIFQAVSAWLLALLRQRPFLLEIRDLWPEFAIDIGILKNVSIIRLARKLERLLYARARHIMVNSPAYKNYLLKQGVPLEKISLIPNGVDPDMFDPETKGENFRRELKLVSKFTITYAGALGLANDVSTVLRAAYHLRDDPDIHFLLVGDGKERANLEHLADELILANVTFIGSRPKSEMSKILAASDVCLAVLKDIPMFRTTYPNKVFDYMAAGRPTILAIDGVIREVIESARGGIFVPPGNHKALAEAVKFLSTNRSEAEAMGISARAYVIAHFNRCEQARDFASLVEHVAKT